MNELSGPALETFLRLGGLKEGDEVKLQRVRPFGLDFRLEDGWVRVRNVRTPPAGSYAWVPHEDGWMYYSRTFKDLAICQISDYGYYAAPFNIAAWRRTQHSSGGGNG